MIFDEPFSYWIFRPEIWIIFGILLISVDLFIGLDFFILPVGISSIIMAGIIYAQSNMWFGEWAAFETWKGAFIYFAILSIVFIFIIKYFFQNPKSDNQDINQY